MGLDYYKVLFLTKGASETEIKQAYKKMALLHHPIREKVERPITPSLRAREQEIREQKRLMDSYQMFYLVSEAFEVLKDPMRRAVYDLYGEKGLKDGLPGPSGFIPPYAYHGDPHRTFRDFFGTDNPFNDLLTSACVPIDFFATSSEAALRAKEPPIYKDIFVELEELYTGSMKKVMICKKILLPDGYRTEERQKVLTFSISPGTPDGAQFCFANEGDQGPNIQAADIIFVIRTRPHPIYTRVGDNLICNTNVNLCEALTGSIVPVISLDQRKFNVAVVHIVRPGYEKIVKNEGFPIFGEPPGVRGDLVLRFNIVYPNTLTQTQKKMTKTALECAVEGRTCYTKRLPETGKMSLNFTCELIPDEPPAIDMPEEEAEEEM